MELDRLLLAAEFFAVSVALADAVVMNARMANMGELLGPMAEMGGGVEVMVLGEPSAQLLEAVAAFGPKVYAHLVGK
jgi:hypothetical protein